MMFTRQARIEQAKMVLHNVSTATIVHKVTAVAVYGGTVHFAKARVVDKKTLRTKYGVLW